MTPDQSEYSSFGRSTKLLLHPKDIPDIQFNSKTEEKGEILPETKVSVVQVVQSTDMVEKGGEISPLLQKTVKLPDINIVELADNPMRRGEILPETAVEKGSDKLYEEQVWFQNPVKCISKWSKALKTGVMYSMLLENKHTASMDSRENDMPSFSFFL